MRSLAVLTTTAAVALIGAASAQNAGGAAGAEQTTATAGATTIGASSPILQAVQAYAAYQNDVGAMRTASVGSADELERAIDTGARHNKDSVSRGWIAYGSMVAAQSPAFIEGVRETAAYYGRDAVIRGMMVDTGWARTLRGGDEATRLVLNSATADAQRIIAVADRYQELAYGLQRQRWANAVAPQQAQRVQRIRGLGVGAANATFAEVARLNAAPVTYTPQSDPTAFGGRRFWDALRGGAQVTEVANQASLRWQLKPERGEAVNRMTTIAALQALGAAESNTTQINTLLSESRSANCLEMAQLQFYQCFSAARFRYENAFCLGQHALRDVGQCINGVAQPAALEGATPLVNGAANTTPVAQTVAAQH